MRDEQLVQILAEAHLLNIIDLPTALATIWAGFQYSAFAAPSRTKAQTSDMNRYHWMIVASLLWLLLAFAIVK
jgi:hypothetical protein